MNGEQFYYTDERFADIQMLRYRLNGFEMLTLRQKKLVYYLSEATLSGRDITFDQFGKHNLKIRKVLEAIYTDSAIDRHAEDFDALEEYLKRIWFSNGIYHHYGCEKFVPRFSEEYLRKAMEQVESVRLPLAEGQTKEELFQELQPAIFQLDYMPKRVNKAQGEDLVQTSACNYYDGVTQQQVEDYYARKKAEAGRHSPSFGLNSRLVMGEDGPHELVWKEGGLYGKAISRIVYWLTKAMDVCENERQRRVLEKLVRYYRSGNLSDFDDYCIEWVSDTEGKIDFVNGFIEVYGDPLGLKASWEGIVEYKDEKATGRTRTISDNAQWFEDHSPVNPAFRKKKVKGVIANVVCAAMLGGDEYPSTAIGINLPNADWIRAEHGSKSVTIGNLTEAYSKAAKGNGMKEEFVIDSDTIQLIERYADVCDDLHTDLHECLGHGSGQLLEGVDPDALKAYGNTIEEARADLFGLYYIADEKMTELGLTPDREAWKAHYYTYMLNGLMTQLVRIAPGNEIEEAHMRNRALIAHWCMAHGKGAVEWTRKDGKTFIRINDYQRLRMLFAELLAEVQRIKSEGDFEAARQLVETYGVKVDATLHAEVLERYRKLDIAPYKGFINPVLLPQRDANGEIVDVKVDYSETYAHQMLRYSAEYGTLI
ncbi:MAG: dihydrofolate reductase [Prevotella sp.]